MVSDFSEHGYLAYEIEWHKEQTYCLTVGMVGQWNLCETKCQHFR